MNNATAVLRHVDEPDRRVMLIGPRVQIGRGVNGPNDIALPAHDASGSRLHATLVCDDGVWSIEDSSLNGTRINGQRLQHQRAVLNDGDYIQIGNTFAYVFHALDMTDLSAPVSFSVDDLPQVDAAEAPEGAREGLHISGEGAVFRDGTRISTALTHTELGLLRALAETPGRVRSFDELARAVWGGPREAADVLEVVRRLWHKIEARPDTPAYLFIRPELGVVLVPQGL